jgi:hypothetical protein
MRGKVIFNFQFSIFDCVKPVMLVAWLSLAGCESPTTPTAAPAVEPIVPAELCWGYQATDIRIVGLSGFSEERYGQIGSQLEVVVEMLDSFGSRIKSPGVFRIELYEYLPRSNDPKGKRVFAWPDADLTRPSDNNAAWRDFLRAYRFDLSMDMRPVIPSSYILEVTCLTPAGKRFTAQSRISYPR